MSTRAFHYPELSSDPLLAEHVRAYVDLPFTSALLAFISKCAPRKSYMVCLFRDWEGVLWGYCDFLPQSPRQNSFRGTPQLYHEFLMGCDAQTIKDFERQMHALYGQTEYNPWEFESVTPTALQSIINYLADSEAEGGCSTAVRSQRRKSMASVLLQHVDLRLELFGRSLPVGQGQRDDRKPGQCRDYPFCGCAVSFLDP